MATITATIVTKIHQEITIEVPDNMLLLQLEERIMEAMSDENIHKNEVSTTDSINKVEVLL